MLRNLPVNVDVRKDRLSSTGYSLLREFEDEHLGQLFHIIVAHAFRVRGKEDIDGVPSDCAREVALKSGGKLDEMGKEHFGMLRRFRHGEGVGKIETELLDVFEGLTAAIRPVHKSEIVEMDVAVHMGVTDLLGKNREQGIFFLDTLGQRQVCRFGAVGDIGILPVGMKNEAVHIIERHSQPGMHLPGSLQTLLDKAGIDEFPDQGGR